MTDKEQARIDAAEAWIALGDCKSAREEIDCLPEKFITHFEVLKIRCAIHRQAKQWKELQTLAKGCIEMYPNVAAFWVYFARALDANGETAAALFQLSLVKERFLASDAVAYYLACFLAKMDRIDEAKEWLAKAFE